MYFDQQNKSYIYLLEDTLDDGALDEVVNDWIIGFSNWDGIFFHQLAMVGYVFERQHAFFPLYPMMMHAGAYCCL